MGSKKDYFIAISSGEGEEGGEEGEAAPDVEPKGTGVNKFTFFVTNDVFFEWTELPVITPKHIREARRIKHIFSGDLETKIQTSPPFFG